MWQSFLVLLGDGVLTGMEDEGGREEGRGKGGWGGGGGGGGGGERRGLQGTGWRESSMQGT